MMRAIQSTPLVAVLSRLILAYYLATPLFLLIDLIWAAPMRVAFIQSDAARYAYYAFCFVFGLAMWRRPSLGPWLGIFESTVNFTLVLLAILLPLWSAADAVAAGAGLPDIGLAHITNAMLSGTILVAGFYARQAELMPMLSRRGAERL